MPYDTPSPFAPLCETCGNWHCACAQSVADIDAWADAYLGTAAQAADYAQGLEQAQRGLERARWRVEEATVGPPRAPLFLETLEQVLDLLDTQPGDTL